VRALAFGLWAKTPRSKITHLPGTCRWGETLPIRFAEPQHDMLGERGTVVVDLSRSAEGRSPAAGSLRVSLRQ